MEIKNKGRLVKYEGSNFISMRVFSSMYFFLIYEITVSALCLVYGS